MLNVSVDGGGTKINVVVFDERHELLGFGHGGEQTEGMIRKKMYAAILQTPWKKPC